MTFSFDVETDVSGDGSYQGQLASSYTNALSAYLQGEGADYVAFLSHVTNGLSVEDALALKAAVESGQFSLSGLFGAAQSKTGEVDGENITDPEPTLTVVIGDSIVVVDLSAMLAGLDTDTWETIVKKDTISHTREFYTESVEPEGYDDGWDEEQPNQAPVLTADDPSNGLVEAGESVTHVVIDGVDTATVLLHPSDPDSDPTTYNLDGWTDAGGGVYTMAGTYGTASLNTATNLVTYTLDNDLAVTNNLTDGAPASDTFTLSITDGELDSDPVDITFEITGTGDWFNTSDSVTYTKTNVGSEQIFSDSIALGTAGTVEDVTATLSAFGDYDRNNENVDVDGDVVLHLQSGVGGTDSDNALNDSLGPTSPYAVVQATVDDGSLDYDLTFSGQVAAGSEATLDITWDYWV